ncbi:MAG: hypothetical protein ACR5LG_14030 [Sodalis sp. (in: enterobacteria)]|uniref:hypothetical protein n=1 Tax=Sodalis sp. (in: enterobacteria) TaxID=1898979 RepID=UPI003F378B3F
MLKAGITAQVSLSNLTLEAARKQITTALSDYVITALAPGEVAVRTQLGALISEVVGVVDYQLLAPSANVVPVVNKQTVQWIRAGIGRAGERIWVPEIIWLWIVNIDNAQVPAYRFRAGSSVAGGKLLTFGQNLIEGLFKDLKPAHTQVVFNYREKTRP